MKKNDKDLTPKEGLSHNPFAALVVKKEALPEGPKVDPAKAAKGPAASAQSNPKKVILRMERKGHGGKEMTRVEKLNMTSTQLSVWLKEIKQSLGCGGVIEGEDLLIQGDQRDRLSAFFTKKGIAAQS